ncbi:hypothetical protein EW146_g5875 [Bondarzewia mesenterica]|uniref:Uncharacterized protein n=1 Tax=Bondarzewia mesenterica TaxID=1095465 RepID=A0A4S4LQ44_9AGAM|nr:hypothetical protein EW146_g5875 [Bondarzewia mesenterica]
MSSTVRTADYSSLLAALADLHKTQYSSLSANTIIFYDYSKLVASLLDNSGPELLIAVLTFGDEDSRLNSHGEGRGGPSENASSYWSVHLANNRLADSETEASSQESILRSPLRFLFSPLLYRIRCEAYMAYYELLNFDFSASHTPGRRWLNWQAWTAVIPTTAILIMRVHALYRSVAAPQPRLVTGVMVVGFLFAMSAIATILGMALRQITVQAIRYPSIHIHFCRWSDVPKYMPIYFLPIAVLEALLAGLSAYAFFHGSGPGLTRAHLSSRLHRILVRDTTIYFVLVFLTYLFNVAVWMVATAGLLELPIPFTMSMTSVLTNRLMLNIYKCHQQRSVMSSVLSDV